MKLLCGLLKKKTAQTLARLIKRAKVEITYDVTAGLWTIRESRLYTKGF